MLKNLVLLFLAFAAYDTIGVAMVYFEYKKGKCINAVIGIALWPLFIVTFFLNKISKKS